MTAKQVLAGRLNLGQQRVWLQALGAQFLAPLNGPPGENKRYAKARQRALRTLPARAILPG